MTFCLVATNRPDSTPDDPVSRMMDDAKKYVVSSSLTNPAWANSTVLTGDAATEVSKLKAMTGPLLQVHGSWQLIQTLLANGLVDELRLWTFPVIVGAGKRLFGQGLDLTHWTLVKSAPCPNGVSMTIYRPG